MALHLLDNEQAMDIFESCLVLLISLITLHFLVKRQRRTSKLPPGPNGLPIVGNLLEVQQKRSEPQWTTYRKWSHIYGDVFTFNVFGSRTVVLNSHKAITELLERRSQNYSDRPNMPMVRDLSGWSWNFCLMEYSEMWRLHRRTFHQTFQPRMMSEYHDIVIRRTNLLVQKLVNSPQDFYQHVRTHAGGIILEIVYGYHILDDNDPYVKLADDAVQGLSATATHGTFLVDYIPVLKYIPAWFPGASFKTRAKPWARDARRLADLPWTLVKQSMVQGTAVPSFCTRNLEKFGISPASEEISLMDTVIKNCAAIAFTGGADTTVSTILSFILAMVLNPDIQVRAQKELDEVIGSRLPDFANRDYLPYINAILSETHRWNPVTPLSVAHRVMKDDIYEGFLIPAGSTVVGNVSAVFQDESLYGPDTKSFNPDRFMKQDGKDLPPDPELIAFGFGRRICPGRYLAVNSVWLAITYILSKFTLAKELDGEGKEIVPVVEYTHGMLSHPLPFKCRFIPRAPTVLNL